MLLNPAHEVITALPQPVVIIDGEGRVVTANAAALDLLGPQLTGAHIRAHLRQPELVAMLDRVLGGAAQGSAPFVVNSPIQEVLWQVEARRMAGGDILLSFQDISDVESAEAQRRDFVANVSHELRSPLTVLSGFVETLQGPAGDDPAARAEFLAIMADQAGRMNRLIADLLSLSRVEAEAKIRPRAPVSLTLVLRATLAALRPQIESAGIDVSCTLPDDLPQVPGDHDQLVQVFHNLIENGIKYGASGRKLEITAHVCPTHPGIPVPVVKVAVRDFGDGVDPIHIPRLTERFYRVDKARARDSGGTGLGLAIVKHILSRHRGRLLIRSTPGEGAVFEAVLPCS